MGCGCPAQKSTKSPQVKVSLPPEPGINPLSLLKLGLVFCQVHPLNPELVPKYRTFLLFSNTDLRQRTVLQQDIFFEMNRNPTFPVDIRENDSKKVISLCLESATELRENLHLALDMLAQKRSGNVLVVFEKSSLGEGSLFEGSNVECFSEEFVKFCMAQREMVKVDIATDYPDLPPKLRLEACRHSNTS